MDGARVVEWSGALCDSIWVGERVQGVPSRSQVSQVSACGAVATESCRVGQVAANESGLGDFGAARQ